MLLTFYYEPLEKHWQLIESFSEKRGVRKLEGAITRISKNYLENKKKRFT